METDWVWGTWGLLVVQSLLNVCEQQMPEIRGILVKSLNNAIEATLPYDFESPAVPLRLPRRYSD